MQQVERLDHMTLLVLPFLMSGGLGVPLLRMPDCWQYGNTAISD
jgi:hypothetical protein